MNSPGNTGEPAFSPFDRLCMKRALCLARRGTGRVSPNPLVGAVIAQDGRVIGEGWHTRYGAPHAEAEAINAARAAGHSLAGADLYCTLEPCCFTAPDKHQPPCAALITQNGLGRVVVAARDPNPRVNGGGLAALKKAGITVEEGLFAAEAERLNPGFCAFHRLGRPFVRLKIAQSLDGRIAAASGDSRWITSEASRRVVHRLRAAYDAVLVGRGTAAADDPELTVRLTRGRNPLRVLLDSRLSTREDARLFDVSGGARTLVVCSRAADERVTRRLRDKGVEVVLLEGGGKEAAAAREARAGLGAQGIGGARSGHGAAGAEPPQSPVGRPAACKDAGLPMRSDEGLPLDEVLAALAGRGVRSVLVEGGQRVFSAFLREGLWDAVSVFIAPLVFGAGAAAVDGLETARVADALRLRDARARRLGDEVLMEGYRVYGNC